MNGVKVWLLTIFATMVYHSALLPFQFKLLSEKKIQSAVGQLSLEELQQLEKFLRKKYKEAIQNNNIQMIQQYDHLIKEWDTGHFDFIINTLSQQKDQLQTALKITLLREKMLMGELKDIPWFIREIAALAWTFEQDARQDQNKQKWPRAQDKVIYLIALVDQIERNQHRVTEAQDITILKNAIDELGIRLLNLRGTVSNVMKRSIDQALEKLRLVEEIRNL
jgi:hypothetical protein